ncbi:hypothetical protein HMPREF1508_0457 [Shuttleworthella sp. MSX8B]|nr:hypothetical protein HMPREF1508_0457 [Shuttleworthia sp. MSX8B]
MILDRNSTEKGEAEGLPLFSAIAGPDAAVGGCEKARECEKAGKCEKAGQCESAGDAKRREMGERRQNLSGHWTGGAVVL